MKKMETEMQMQFISVSRGQHKSGSSAAFQKIQERDGNRKKKIMKQNSALTKSAK